MNVNGVTSAPVKSGYSTSSASGAKETAKAAQAQLAAPQENAAAVYEPSSEKDAGYRPNTALVEQLKTEQANIQKRFLNTVRDTLGRQGKEIAIGQGIWKQFAQGDFQVDEATRLEAQKNIAEDGYWGVEQTSDRLVKFATALTGGDPSKLDSMIEAFKKGFEQAEKAWGGKLPELSQRTYDAVLEKFDKLKQESAAVEG